MDITDKACNIIKRGYVNDLFLDVDKLTKVVEAICNIQYYGTAEIGLITLNSCQRTIIAEVVKQYSAGLPVRIMICKSRRVGGSMISAILVSLLMMGNERYRAVVASHELGRVSIYLRDLYHVLLDYLPNQLRDFRGKDKRRMRGHGHTFTKNYSTLSVDVEAEIRGRATDFLHCSEFAFFKDGAGFLNAYRPTLPDRHGTFAILESTPHAYDDHFHRMYEDALAGNSTYTPLFFAWQEFAENQIAVTEEEEAEILNSLHVQHTKFGNELQLVRDYGVSAGQIKWRRNQLMDMDLDSFRREWPSSIEEAFAEADTRNVFDMDVLRQMARTAKEPRNQGEMRTEVSLHWQKPSRFLLRHEGLVQIWQHPEPGEDYVGGSDHSLGRGDWNSLTICKRMPLQVVATLHGDRIKQNIMPAEFAEQMYHLLRYYNEAYCAIEINDTGLVVATQLSEWGYPNMLSHRNIFVGETLQEFGGWRNTTKTRTYSIERLRYYVKNKLIAIPDPLTIREMMHFVYATPNNDLSKEKAQAARKGQTQRGTDVTGLHDDRVFSLISALLAHEALEAPLTQREKAIQAEQVDHDIIYADEDNLYPQDEWDIEIPFDEVQWE